MAQSTRKTHVGGAAEAAPPKACPVQEHLGRSLRLRRLRLSRQLLVAGEVARRNSPLLADPDGANLARFNQTVHGTSRNT